MNYSLLQGLISLIAVTDLVHAQWAYPPPLPEDATVSDYVSGSKTPNKNTTYAVNDVLFGGFQKVSVPVYLIYRCAHSPSNTVIRPSNSSFSSRVGAVAADGTWEWFSQYIEWAYTNAYAPGQDTLYFFTIPPVNETTGNMCWLELSAGSETNQVPPLFVRNITLDGSETQYHWYTEPWIVLPKREDSIIWPVEIYENGTSVKPAPTSVPEEPSPGSRHTLGNDVLWAVVLGGAVVFAIMI
jgi:hypothetical protein